jgi:hypothetical protein
VLTRCATLTGFFCATAVAPRRLRHLFIDVLVEKGYIVKMVRQPQHDRILLFISTPMSLLLAQAERASADFTLTTTNSEMLMGPSLSTVIVVLCCPLADVFSLDVWCYLFSVVGCRMSDVGSLMLCWLMLDVLLL